MNIPKSVPEKGDDVGSSIEEVSFSQWMIGSKYSIIKAPKEELDKWKAGVDEVYEVLVKKNFDSLETLMRKGKRPAADIGVVKNILENEKLDEIDLRLLAIGIFVIREKAPWDFVESAIKIVKGGEYRMESFFDADQYVNCYDVSVLVKELAAAYGIEGKVMGKNLSHAYFETVDGKVSDTMWGWRRAGLFQTKEDFDKYKDELGILGRMGIKKGH